MGRLWSFAVLPVAFCGWLIFTPVFTVQAQSNPDDSCWQPLGTGMGAGTRSSFMPKVADLTVYNGRLIVGGGFYDAGGVEVIGIASWNGESWSDYTSLPPLGEECQGEWPLVSALGIYNGKLVASGQYIDCEAYYGKIHAAIFDNSVWAPLGQYMPDGSCYPPIVFDCVPIPDGTYKAGATALLAYSSGLVAACGSPYTQYPEYWEMVVGDQTSCALAFWDGTEWSGMDLVPPLTQGTYAYASCLAVFDSTLFVGGTFRTSGEPDFYQAQLTPEGWTRSNYPSNINAFLNYKGQLAMASSAGIFLKDDTSLTMIGATGGPNAAPLALAEYHGQLVAAGQFDSIGNVAAKNIALWDGTNWHPLGSGVDSLVAALEVYDGHLFVGGRFRHAGDKAASCIAQWTTPVYLTIRDANKDSIPNMEFELVRVTNNRPYYSEDTLGSFVTDSLGRLTLTWTTDSTYTLSLLEGDVVVNKGDPIKIARLVHTEPSVRHSAILGSAYTIHLDNGDFTNDGRLFFDTVAAGDQDIDLDHTEFRYNLLVSLEWDAAELYVDGLRKDFRQMSNYLYDVTDGQVRIDTVVIFDDLAGWNQADVRIRASNIHNPNAGVWSINRAGGWPITMPRKWFGNEVDSRRYSYLAHPLMDELSDNYRTLAHEFGHYAMGLHDEYRCTDAFGNSIPCCMAPPAGNFGFMQYQYDRDGFGGPMASEMSSEYMYQSAACQTTDQWTFDFRSCWDYFERRMDTTINGLYVPVRKPHATDSLERRTPPGLDYFPGPNDDLYNLDYNVGRLVRFVSPVLPPAPNVRSVRIKVNGVPAGGAFVSSEQVSTGWIIDQGKTTDSGWIWVLGIDVTQDTIEASGFGFAEVPGRLTAAGGTRADRVWLSGSSAATSGDSVVIQMNPVDGSFPFICEGRLTESGWEYHLVAEYLLTSPPSVTISPHVGVGTYSFSATYQGYGLTLPEDTVVEGTATVRAFDYSDEPFSFPTSFKRMEIDQLSDLSHLVGPGGDVVVSLDTANAAIQALLVVSSPYPVLTNGLSTEATQVGQAHSLSIRPELELLGANALGLYYTESDLSPIAGYSADEEALQVFRWDSTAHQWLPLQSVVDTAVNVVSAAITETGVYTLFAAQLPTDVPEDDSHGSLPYRFELSQNFPNPFNPVTTIEYSLPERSRVSIEVFNVVGQKVRTLVDRMESAGTYTISWDSRNGSGIPVATGVYLYRFQAGEHVETKKMILLK